MGTRKVRQAEGYPAVTSRRSPDRPDSIDEAMQIDRSLECRLRTLAFADGLGEQRI